MRDKYSWSSFSVQKVLLKLKSVHLTLVIAVSANVLGSASTTSSIDIDMTTQLISWRLHYSDIIMSAMASQITGISIVCSTVCSGANKKTHQSFASLAFVRGTYWWPMDSPHKRSVPRKMSLFDDVIMLIIELRNSIPSPSLNFEFPSPGRSKLYPQTI